MDTAQPTPASTIAIRLRGTIRTLCRGYGFIVVDEGTASDHPDHFFHKSDLRPGAYFSHLSEGTAVEFTPDQEEKGPAARDVVILGRTYP